VKACVDNDDDDDDDENDNNNDNDEITCIWREYSNTLFSSTW
jgi:hypothetical protein